MLEHLVEQIEQILHYFKQYRYFSTNNLMAESVCSSCGDDWEDIHRDVLRTEAKEDCYCLEDMTSQFASIS